MLKRNRNRSVCLFCEAPIWEAAERCDACGERVPQLKEPLRKEPEIGMSKTVQSTYRPGPSRMQEFRYGVKYLAKISLIFVGPVVLIVVLASGFGGRQTDRAAPTTGRPPVMDSQSATQMANRNGHDWLKLSTRRRVEIGLEFADILRRDSAALRRLDRDNLGYEIQAGVTSFYLDAPENRSMPISQIAGTIAALAAQ